MTFCQSYANLLPGLGTKEDIKAFIAKFSSQNTVRYEDFAECWRNSQMYYMFAGRFDFELREAIRVALENALAMFIPGLNMQSLSCVIYILYAIYGTQGVYPKVKIRVTPERFSNLLEFVNGMAENQHYDLVFIFTRLRMERAFSFVATDHALGLNMKKRNAAAKSNDHVPLRLVSSAKDDAMALIENLSAIHEEYQRVKCVSTNPGQSNPPPSLSLVNSEFITDLTKYLTRLDDGKRPIRVKKRSGRKRTASNATTSDSEADHLSDTDSGNDSSVAVEESIHSRREKIRNKAFKDIKKCTGSQRHRQILAESSQSDGADSPARSSKRKSPQKKSKSMVSASSLEATNDYLKKATASTSWQKKKGSVKK